VLSLIGAAVAHDSQVTFLQQQQQQQQKCDFFSFFWQQRFWYIIKTNISF
jgi:hypothetical protein